MKEVTNKSRAEWARVAVEAYCEVRGGDGDLRVDIGDLICDLLHLARRDCKVKGAMGFAMRCAAMNKQEQDEDTEE